MRILETRMRVPVHALGGGWVTRGLVLVDSWRCGSLATLFCAVMLLYVLVAGTTASALAADGAWVVQDSGTTHKLNGVCFVDDQDGWAVGDGGTVLHTLNGGETWQPVSTPASATLNLQGVDFVSATCGWIVGQGSATDSAIMHTDDGGLTWRAQSVPDSAGQPLAYTPAFRSVAFFDEYHGVVGGTMASVFNMWPIAVTWDGGATWAVKHHVGGGNMNAMSVEVVDALTAWAAGVDAFWGGPGLIHTTDGGDTWTVVSPGLGDVSATLTDVEFVDPMHGWVATGGLTPLEARAVLSTVDGGATWQHRHYAEMGLGGDGPTELDFVDASTGWGVGFGCWRTIDGGQTWQAESLPWRGALTDVDFPSATCGWAVGLNGKILHYVTSADTTPPTVTASGFDAAWHNHAVTVTLTATDAESGVDRLWWSLNDDSTPNQIVGSTGQVTIPAAADHSGDGDNVLWYSGEDLVGNHPDPVTTHCHVKIDTRKPRTKAPYAASVVRYRVATLRYKVVDARPGSPTATVTIAVRNMANKTVKIWGPYKGKAVNKLLAATFTCRLPRGTYRFSVFATDAAGNAQASIGHNFLYVK